MNIVLTPDKFTNNKLTVQYGDREALFTIIDEEFEGINRLGRVNRIVILVRKFANTGQVSDAKMCTPIIGMGDGIIGITSDNASVRGQVLCKDNMEECVIHLYEDD